MKSYQAGFGSVALVVVFALIILGAGGGYLWFTNQAEAPETPVTPEENAGLRETEPAVPTKELCEAKCRDQYGGSGSAGFDACIRACGAGGAARTGGEAADAGAIREAACPSPGPACPSPQTPVCHDGKWYCRLYSGGAAGARVFPETNNRELNFPTDAQLREGACGEPGLACEVPTTPECKNGKWICVPPAKGVN